MEPIREFKSQRFSTLKMFREDLDQLVEFFQKGCSAVTISSKTYRYDSLDEMKEHVGPKVRELDIRGENPGVHFLFNQTGVTPGSNPPTQYAFNEIRTEDITDAADTQFYKIKEFLAKYQ